VKFDGGTKCGSPPLSKLWSSPWPARLPARRISRRARTAATARMVADTHTVADLMEVAEATSTVAASTAANPTAVASATLAAAAAVTEARFRVCSNLRPLGQIADRDSFPRPGNIAAPDTVATLGAAQIAPTVRGQARQPIPRHGPTQAETGAIRIDQQAHSDPIVYRARGPHSALHPREAAQDLETLPPAARDMPPRSAQIALRAPSEILPMAPRAKDGVPVGEPRRGECPRQT
jgi:hypothetical protein